jgi:hypothetical protein
VSGLRYRVSRYWRGLVSERQSWAAFHHTLPPFKRKDCPTYDSLLVEFSVLPPSALANVRTLGLRAPVFDVFTQHAQRFDNDVMPQILAILGLLASSNSSAPPPLRDLQLSGMFLENPQRYFRTQFLENPDAHFTSRLPSSMRRFVLAPFAQVESVLLSGDSHKEYGEYPNRLLPDLLTLPALRQLTVKGYRRNKVFNSERRVAVPSRVQLIKLPSSVFRAVFTFESGCQLHTLQLAPQGLYRIRCSGDKDDEKWHTGGDGGGRTGNRTGGGLAGLTNLTALDIDSKHVSSADGFARDIQRLPLHRLHLHGEFPRPTNGWGFMRHITTLIVLHMWHSQVCSRSFCFCFCCCVVVVVVVVVVGLSFLSACSFILFRVFVVWGFCLVLDDDRRFPGLLAAAKID